MLTIHVPSTFLTERFGQTHKVTNSYMQAILQFPTPNFSLSSLRSFYDKLEAYIRGVESLEQSQDSFGATCIRVII